MSPTLHANAARPRAKSAARAAILARAAIFGLAAGVAGVAPVSAGVAIVAAPTIATAGNANRIPDGNIRVADNGLATANLSVAIGTRSALRWDRDGRAGVLGDLGTNTAGRSTSTVTALAAAGTAYGHSYRYSATHQLLGQAAVRWDAGTSVPIELAMPAGAWAAASDANDAGHVVGEFAAPDTGDPRAVRWSVDGTVEVLPLPAANGAARFGAIADAVSDAGTAVGRFERFNASGGSLGSRLVRWDVGAATPVDLGPFRPLQSDGRALMNAAGVIVASGTGGLGSPHIRWSADGSTSATLDPLGYDPSGFPAASLVSGLGESGDAVGYSDKHVNNRHMGRFAVVWPAGSSVPVELERLRVPVSSSFGDRALAINASGYVVGRDSYYALMWRPDGSAVDLSTRLPAGRGWDALRSADAISDTGWIAGVGHFDPDGTGPIASQLRHYTLLLPEAGTYGRGDANFDTLIGFADLVVLAQHYGTTNATQDVNVGDFDLDGAVNFSDLVTLAQHYGGGTGALPAGAAAGFAADWSLAQSLVPEPAAIVAALALPAVAARRRAAR